MRDETKLTSPLFDDSNLRQVKTSAGSVSVGAVSDT